MERGSVRPRARRLAGAPVAALAALLAPACMPVPLEHRTAIGLPALTLAATLSALAREHRAAMAAGAVGFGHDGFEGRAATAGTRLGTSRMAENVGMNNFPPATAADQVVRGWVGSPGHRANLEGPFTLSGVGASTSPSGEIFVTQLYAAR
jgi:uncharacterized protein YkwD